MDALVHILAITQVAITRRYVKDFGEVKLAVVERQTGRRYFKIATEIVTDGGTVELWDRLERIIDSSESWLEAQ